MSQAAFTSFLVTVSRCRDVISDRYQRNLTISMLIKAIATSSAIEWQISDLPAYGRDLSGVDASGDDRETRRKLPVDLPARDTIVRRFNESTRDASTAYELCKTSESY